MALDAVERNCRPDPGRRDRYRTTAYGGLGLGTYPCRQPRIRRRRDDWDGAGGAQRRSRCKSVIREKRFADGMVLLLMVLTVSLVEIGTEGSSPILLFGRQRTCSRYRQTAGRNQT